jgi:hypothetical protein
MFIDFYQPVCPHCQGNPPILTPELEPIWEQIGIQYKEDSNIIIGKMNVELNHPPFTMKYVPHLVFIPRCNKNNPIIYKGEKNFKNLLEFINKNKC